MPSKTAVCCSLFCAFGLSGHCLYNCGRSKSRSFLSSYERAEIEPKRSLWLSGGQKRLPGRHLLLMLTSTCAILPPCLDIGGEVVSSPSRMWMELNSYWRKIESWLNSQARDLALERLEDPFAIYLPHSLATFEVTSALLMKKIRRMKSSAPEYDGWSVKELQALPSQAWESLLCLLKSPQLGLSRSFLSLCEVSNAVPKASDIRPVDIFSVILRGLASVQMDLPYTWRCTVLHKDQCAMRHGTIQPIAKITYMTEAIAYGVRPVYPLRLGSSRLFNSVCPIVSGRIAELAGLASRDVAVILAPLLTARYIVEGCPSRAPSQPPPLGGAFLRV